MFQTLIVCAASAQENFAEQIATNTKNAIYNLETEQVETLVRTYLEGNTQVAGVKIIDSLDSSTIFSAYRNEEGTLIGEKLPNFVLGFPKSTAEVIFENEMIGLVEVHTFNKSVLNLSFEEKRWLAENPEITIGVEDWFPFIRSDAKGGVDGIAGDFLGLVLEKTGLKGRVIPDIWSTLIHDFERGEIDLLPATYFTDDRTRFGLYSDPYFSGREFLYVREDNNEITSFESLKGKRIAIVKGFGTIPKIRENFPEIEIVITNSQVDSIYAILEGRADATLEQQIVMEQILLNELITGIKAVPQSAFDAPQIYLFSHIEKPLLASILNKGLNNITERERKEIVSKWLGASLNTYQAPTNTDDFAAQASTNIIFNIALISLGLLGTLFLIFVLLGRSKQNSDLSQLFGSRAFRTSILFGLSVLVATVTVMNWIAIEDKRASSAQKVNRELQIVLNNSIDRINVWIKDRQAFLLQLGRDQNLVDSIGKIEENKSQWPEAELLAQIRNYISSAFLLSSRNYQILSLDSTILLARDMNTIGTLSPIFRLHPDLVDQIFQGESVFLPPVSASRLQDLGLQADDITTDSMFIGTPIVSLSGQVIAAFFEHVRAEDNLSANLRLSRVGASGETYAVTPEGKMLTESRFKNDLFELGFKQKPNSELIDIDVREPGGNMTLGYQPDLEMTQRAFTVMMADVLRLRENNDGYVLGQSRVLDSTSHPFNVNGYPDYRGVMVVGAWTWLEELGFGITSELDHAEAYQDYFNFRYNLILISSIATILAIATTVFTLVLGQRSHKTLRLANEQLEDRVEERTQELQESETRTRSIIENAADAIIVISAKGIIQTFSPAAEQIFGFGANEVKGQNIKMLMPQPTAGQHDGYLSTYLAKHEKHIIGQTREVVGKRKNGEEFPMDLAVSEMLIGDETFFTGIIRDITDRKEAEAERLRSEAELKDAYEVISGSISYASHIQQSVLPDMEPLNAVLNDHFVIWEPRDVVGGDIYWCDFWGDGIHLTLADCTGHGVPGAFVTLLATGAFEKAKNDVFSGDLQAVMTSFHQNLQFTLGQHTQGGTTDDGLELGSCYIDPEMTKMFFVGARFDLFIVENGTVDVIKGTKKGLGYRKVSKNQLFESHEIELKAGRRFYMTSDGLIDQVGGTRNRGYGKKRFSQLLLKIQHLSMSDQKDAILDDFRAYQGDQTRRDDVSLIGFEVTPLEASSQSYHI